ncbi:unnamed protein product [Pleuronectes platessa]|uniref:Uncharacterized protein n=1 Tax=Pleuronectes platessa TaxID=8262 RepID=A0A9N7VSX2_PLEPL|nr:unnamed protein product [Pleuronectes platessa]
MANEDGSRASGHALFRFDAEECLNIKEPEEPVGVESSRSNWSEAQHQRRHADWTSPPPSLTPRCCSPEVGALACPPRRKTDVSPVSGPTHPENEKNQERKPGACV